ncbi:MAG: hypothetical protein RSA20_06025 [Oscillospiraceae bacterium]
MESMETLLFSTIWDVLDWMEKIKAGMETHQSDCNNNEANLFEYIDNLVANKNNGLQACGWWLVRKDGAQMGNTFAMLALAVNHYTKEFENPDFTVYSIAYTPEGEKHWSVSW